MAETKNQQQMQGKVFPFVAGALVIGAVWVVSNYFGSGVLYNGSFSPENAGISRDNSGYVGAPVVSDSKGSSNGVVGNMTQDRKVTQNYLSIHVKSVVSFHKDVSGYVLGVKGKVMNEAITESSDTQAEKGTLHVLVPNEEAPAFLNYLESKAIKVVDQSVTSYEISQEYTDISRKLAQYEETYKKTLTFYNNAKSVTDLLSIQQQLDQVQYMIDSLKGRQQALTELSENTQYTVYSSTSEYDLPYVPTGTFQFAKTFKLAVRALVGVTDSILAYVIYLIVFSPLVIILGLAVWGVKKVIQKKG